MALHFHDVMPIGIDERPKLQPPFTVYRAIKRPDESLLPHAHNDAQLTFAASGMVQVLTDQGMWLVPPQLAAWIPSDVRHSLDIVSDAEFWMVHLRPDVVAAWGFERLLDRAFALRVTPLLRTLLSEAVSIDARSPKVEFLVRLMLYELTAMPDAPTFLPLPSSRTGRRVADVLLADRRCELGLREIVSRAATSVRTASRLFPAETGLTIKAWRQRARIVAAMEQLGRGDTPANVAHRVGFASTAAFSYAFRQIAGVTPTAFTTAPLARRPHHKAEALTSVDTRDP